MGKGIKSIYLTPPLHDERTNIRRVFWAAKCDVRSLRRLEDVLSLFSAA